MLNNKKLAITDVVLRDAHQSLLATRMRIDDMLPIAAELDKIGFWSLETWGGATFDSCIRFLGEDPWQRIRSLKEVMPNTPQQMLFRGQNILGYRHYADDVVAKFVERAAINGIDVFRIFDAMNDVRNLETAIKAAVEVEKHAQATISYTVSPVHTLDSWLDMGARLEDMGAHSLCIKDMAGLLKPYDAYELVSGLKKRLEIPIALHCHATTGLSTATLLKAIEAGVDIVDTSISSMSMTYGHTATETIVASYQGTSRDPQIDLKQLEPIATYFREVRKKYEQFEGSLKGIDARILTAQVPGGMLTNMESQLIQQGAADKFDQVLEEIPKVREDLGFIPLVTPTSQIVGTQAVLNVLTGERYKNLSKEAAGVLKGEYGATPAPVNKELQQKALAGKQAITVRPADLIDNELDALQQEFDSLQKEHGFSLSNAPIDDLLTYALFPQVGLKFLNNRHDPTVFEPAPTIKDSSTETSDQIVATKSPAVDTNSVKAAESYQVVVDGQTYQVEVSPSNGQVQAVEKAVAPVTTASQSNQGEPLLAPLAGNILKVMVSQGQQVQQGELLFLLEAMKMETEIKASKSGQVTALYAKQGDAVSVGDKLLVLG